MYALTTLRSAWRCLTLYLSVRLELCACLPVFMTVCLPACLSAYWLPGLRTFRRPARSPHKYTLLRKAYFQPLRHMLFFLSSTHIHADHLHKIYPLCMYMYITYPHTNIDYNGELAFNTSHLLPFHPSFILAAKHTHDSNW